MNEFESAFAGLDSRLAEGQKSIDALTNAFRRLRLAARNGNIAELEKGLAAVVELGREAALTVQALPGSWTFNARTYLGEGYAAELVAAAEEADIRLVERDGRLYAFPLLLRIDPREVAVRVGRKRERRIRPKELLKQVAAMQKRPQRFREQQFLDLLYRTYQPLAGSAWREIGRGPGPVIPLAEVHSLLTLLPGSDYPIEEFGRDLLLLDRKPNLLTRDGCGFSFPGSALARERVRRIVAYDEEGRERMYIGLSFVRKP